MLSTTNTDHRPKLIALLLIAVGLFSLCYFNGLAFFKSFIIFVFAISILGSLFFWDMRMGIMFIGASIYLLVGAVTPDQFVHHASLEVILFLISMMIVVGMMKDVGLFSWLITVLLRIKNINGKRLFFIILILSALFSSLMGEVASIMIMVITILQICDMIDIDPVPLVICSILATNIGSAATVLGNPVGILIASHSGLSFEDFLVHALPNSAVNLILVIGIIMVVYRKYIATIDDKLKEYTQNFSFLHLINIPADRQTRVSIFIFLATIALISLHKRLELLIGLEENALMLMFPILSAGIVLMYNRHRARHYIEKEVEWSSIIFFMFLFAQAGVIHVTGVAESLAHSLVSLADTNTALSAIVLISSAVLSSVLDNVVAVSTYIPVIKELEVMSTTNTNLWWALLFGACYGGNITVIGSTANIVALGLLEKQRNIKITFQQWIRIGFLIGLFNLITTLFLLKVHIFFFG